METCLLQKEYQKHLKDQHLKIDIYIVTRETKRLLIYLLIWKSNMKFIKLLKPY